MERRFESYADARAEAVRQIDRAYLALGPNSGMWPDHGTYHILVAERARVLYDMPVWVHPTRADAIERDIIPALGDTAADYDLDAIFDECYEYSAEYGGFVQTCDDEAFWAAVQRADVSTEEG